MVTVDAERVSRFTKTLKVERPADGPWVIRNVKLCGLQSENGYEFEETASESAVKDGLYSKVVIHRDHKFKQGVGGKREVELNRDPADVYGYIDNESFSKGDGPYGDAYFTKIDEFTKSVCLAAENNPSMYGFSHVSLNEKDPSGRKVTKIKKVYSVDIVSRGATVKNMAESPHEVATESISVTREDWEKKLLIDVETLTKLIESPERKQAVNTETKPEVKAEAVKPEVKASIGFEGAYDLQEQKKLNLPRNLLSVLGKLEKADAETVITHLEEVHKAKAEAESKPSVKTFQAPYSSVVPAHLKTKEQTNAESRKPATAAVYD